MATKPETRKILTIAEIDLLPLVERYKLYKENVISPFRAIKTAQKKATDSLHVASKVHASLKREYTSLIAKAGSGKVIGTITAGTSEKEFFEKHCGGVPSPRVLAVSTFLNAMCMTEVQQAVLDKDGNPVMVEEAQKDDKGQPVLKDGKPVMVQVPQTVMKPLLDEVKQFDPHSGNSLEIAAACISHERKNSPEGWMTTDNTLDVISAMSTAGDATTKLKEIRLRQKGTKEKNEEEAPLTIAAAIAFLMEAIKNAGETLKVKDGEEIAADLFKSTYFDMGAAWANSGVDEAIMQKWTTNIERGVAPTMEVKSTEAPAQPEAKEENEAALAS